MKELRPAVRNPWKTTKNVFLPYDFSYARALKRARGKDGGERKSRWGLWAKARNIPRSGERKSSAGAEDATRAGNSIGKALIPIVIATTATENPVLASTGRQPAVHFYTYHFRAANDGNRGSRHHIAAYWKMNSYLVRFLSSTSATPGPSNTGIPPKEHLFSQFN